jgi:integrase
VRKALKTISKNGLSLDVKQFADGRFGFDQRDEHGRQCKTRLNSLADAVAAADRVLTAGTAGTVDLSRIDRDDYLEFLKWRNARGTSRPIPALVDEFLAEKKTSGISFYTARDYANALLPFALAFKGPLSSVYRAQVISWLDERKTQARRWNNILAGLKSLCVWARKNRALTAELHDIETISPKRIRQTVETYSPAEMVAILAKVEDEWLPAVALGAFAGCRPEEVAPDPKAGKLGMVWGDIDLRRGKVIIRAEVSKTRHKRFIPINPALLSFLGDLGPASDPIAPLKKLSNQSRRWTDRWIRDGLRHSYASYRLAETQDLAALALEMGNSPGIIRRHYDSCRFPEESAEWFAIRATVKESLTVELSGIP